MLPVGLYCSCMSPLNHIEKKALGERPHDLYLHPLELNFWRFFTISLSSLCFSPPVASLLPLFPSEDKLWLGPDIPSNLLSQQRVKRARVLRRKHLYMQQPAPSGDKTHHGTVLACWESARREEYEYYYQLCMSIK